MGNSCSESFDFKTRALKPEMHIRDFKDTYKFLKFPKSLAFTNDPSIFRLRHRLSEEHYVLKRIVFSTEKELSLFLNRLDKLIFLEHDNLLKIYNYAVERNQLKDTNVSFTLNVVLENFDHTLKDEITWRIQKEKTFKDGLIKNFLVCLTDALEFLQLKNISIGNLKPSTIYITRDGHPKLMYLGSLPSTSHHTEEVQTPSLTQLRYMSPQARTNFTETFFPEKQTSPSEPSAGLMPSPNSQFKSDVFSLGLIILEMMSMKSINGLNGNDCSNMRQYRVIQCDKEFEAWFCNVVELMLKENEANRPDFLDLKKLLIMEECMEFTKGLGKDNSQLTGNNAENYKGTIEMKMMKNRSEFRLPAKFFVEPSDYSDTSLLTEISQEEKTSYERSKAKTGDIVSDLSTTKLSTDVSGETSGKKKANEMLLNDLEEKEEDGIEEILIEKEKELISLFTEKINKIKKLGVSMEEKQLSKETLRMLSEFIKSQVHLNELVVAIPNTKLTDTGLGIISEGVTGIQEIVRCYFDFRKTKITDAGLELFGKCLTDKPKLTQFGANFSDNKITSKGCEEVAKWFEYFGNIKSLALNIGGNRIGDDGLVVIGDALEKLRELEIIMVFVHNCEIEGKEGLIAFFEGLNKIEKLRKMNLDFASNLLEDKEIELIIKYLEGNMADEISINLKDNCVSEEARTYFKGKLAKKENLNVIF